MAVHREAHGLVAETLYEVERAPRSMVARGGSSPLEPPT
jgi:hypothetical protein